MIELFDGEFWVVHRSSDVSPMACLSSPLGEFQLNLIKVHERGKMASYFNLARNTLKYPCTNKRLRLKLLWAVCYETLPGKPIKAGVQRAGWSAETIYFKSWILLKWYPTEDTNISPIDTRWGQYRWLAQLGKLSDVTLNFISVSASHTCQAACLV